MAIRINPHRRLTACVATAFLAASTCSALAADTPKVSDDDRARIESVVHDYIMAHPEVVLQSLQSMQERQRAAEADRVKSTIASESEALRQTKGDFVAGNAHGDVTLVEFFDYNCAYCRKAASTIQGLLADDKKLRVVFKEWPIRGSASEGAARVSMAAQKQPNFLAFHFALMRAEGQVDEGVALKAAEAAGLDMKALKKDMASQEIADHLAATYALAAKIGLGGTPAFVIGDELIPGAISESDFRKVIAHTRETCANASC